MCPRTPVLSYHAQSTRGAVGQQIDLIFCCSKRFLPTKTCTQPEPMMMMQTPTGADVPIDKAADTAQGVHSVSKIRGCRHKAGQLQRWRC